MIDLKRILEIKEEYINIIGGHYHITEFNGDLNRINRTIIRAYKRKYNSCILGKINRANILTEYKKGMIYNFECDFIIEEFNKNLHDMIYSFNNMKCSDPQMQQLDKIYKKIDELNGITLKWV